MTMSTAAAPRLMVTRSSESRSRSAWVAACRRKARRSAGGPLPSLGSIYSSPFKTGDWRATWIHEGRSEAVFVNHAEDITLVGSGGADLRDFADADSWTWLGRDDLPGFAERHTLDFDDRPFPPIDCRPGD